ncbi:MAG: tRNA (guanosine(37)-N1)-methyltransferase TrmD [Caldisericia bacterium]|nr:tRNA (guanosine(37)-N1)-methyltransferase TrmD [Caldisericia bacterium]
MTKKLVYLTTFPEILESYFRYSLPGKAVDRGLIEPKFINIRDYTKDKHRTTDDTPFGGGPGMVMKLEPIISALKDNNLVNSQSSLVLLPSPKGKVLNQKLVHYLSSFQQLVFLCGHYEGIDDRIIEYVDMPISIGNYILGGGEISSVVITDAVVRLIDGVLNNDQSHVDESFENDNLLEQPNYTRPAEFNDFSVPEVLTSGHHKNIENWRRTENLRWTLLLKPELINRKSLSSEDLKRLREIKVTMNNWLDTLLRKR